MEKFGLSATVGIQTLWTAFSIRRSRCEEPDSTRFGVYSPISGDEISDASGGCRYNNLDMANLDDVRRFATALPGVNASPEGTAFSVTVKGKEKGFAWVWNERVELKKPKVPNPEVWAISVPNLMAKDLLIEESPEKYVIDPHYQGYPAVLVRLSEVTADELEDLLIEGWKTKATDALLKQLPTY